MPSDNLATEPSRRTAASILMISSLGRNLLNEVIGLRLQAFSGDGTSGILVSLAVLTIFFVAQTDPPSTPTPTPTPLPF